MSEGKKYQIHTHNLNLQCASKKPTLNNTMHTVVKANWLYEIITLQPILRIRTR